MVDVMSPETKLASGRLYAVEKMPYFAAALHALTPVWVERGTLGTFGVTPTSLLIVDPEAVERWTVPEIGVVLLHEAMHVLREHSARAQRISAIQEIWGIAVDGEINDDLAAAKLPLPKEGILPRKFNLPNGKTAEEYYAMLLKQAQRCPQCGNMPGDGGQGQGDDGQGQSSTGRGQGKRGKGRKPDKEQGSGPCPRCSVPEKPTATGGWCGSGSGGSPVPGEPSRDGSGASQGEEGASRTSGQPLTDAEAGGRSEAELATMRKRVAAAIQEAQEKRQGTVPAGLARWAETFQRPPKIDWRQKLAQIARHATGYRPGAVDFRYHRPSRRQGAVGYGLGCPILPALVRPIPRVAVAVDTSGSMSGHDLTTAVVEAAGILNALGARVTFLSCDARVEEVKEVATAMELAESLRGGGGTSFIPVFDAIAKMRPRPEVLVYATDGQGPAPLAPPPGLRTIWLLVGKQATEPGFPGSPWGDMVRVTMDD